MAGSSTGGSFLGDARSRLLPLALPMRFFGAAAVFHLLAWLALAWAALDGPVWQAGLGWSLAALHLATLGTLVCSAVGASLQLLPVATRQPIRRQQAIAWIGWLLVPGVAVLALGMGLRRPPLLAIGAAAVLAALAIWGVLLAANLRGARGMPGVVLHGWGAMAALLLLALSAVALVAWWNGWPLLPRDASRMLHGVSGPLGVMGLLALGLSYILLPMFALAPVPSEGSQELAATAALVALLLALLAPLSGEPAALRGAALAAGALAIALHLRLVQQVLARGLRRDLGRSLLLMRCGAVALALLPVLGLWAVADPAAAASRLWTPVVVVAWLTSFLFGVLQRIVPFLAAMHAARGQRRPPTPSSLTDESALDWHAGAHLSAVLLLTLSAFADSAWLALLAALSGAAGAAAFLLFMVTVRRRLRAALAAAPAPSRGG